MAAGPRSVSRERYALGRSAGFSRLAHAARGGADSASTAPATASATASRSPPAGGSLNASHTHQLPANTTRHTKVATDHRASDRAGNGEAAISPPLLPI